MWGWGRIGEFKEILGFRVQSAGFRVEGFGSPLCLRCSMCSKCHLCIFDM